MLNWFKEYRVLKDNIKELFILLHIFGIIGVKDRLGMDKHRIHLECGNNLRKLLDFLDSQSGYNFRKSLEQFKEKE
jgi:hypothetical protein